MPMDGTITSINVPLERDLFLRMLIRELAGTLEEVVGYDEAAGYVSLVGQTIGDWINTMYRQALETPALTRSQVARVLVDLKAHIGGEFSIVEQDARRIVLKCTACPFEDKVVGRPSMCMMTSNVFGIIASGNLGYAKVALEKTIANGDGECVVAVYLDYTPEAAAASGREYFGTLVESK